MKLASISMFLALAWVSPFANASCPAPIMPDIEFTGGDLSVDAFNALTADVVAFDDNSNAYRACLDAILENPKDASETEWRNALDSYNAITSTQATLYEFYAQITEDFLNQQSKQTKATQKEAQ